MVQVQQKKEVCMKQCTVKDTRTDAQRRYIEKLKKRTLCPEGNMRPFSITQEQLKYEQQIIKTPNHLRFVIDDLYPKETRIKD